MSGLRRIFVDFSNRDPEGRLYVARLSAFDGVPRLRDRFVGTDFEEFEVECQILAIDRLSGRVFHRPVDPVDVPGTSAEIVAVPHKVGLPAHFLDLPPSQHESAAPYQALDPDLPRVPEPA